MSIEQQLDLELAMVNRGSVRYWKTQTNAIENGRGDETTFSRRLLPNAVLQMVNKIDEDLETRRSSAYMRILGQSDSAITATITMKAVLSGIASPRPLATLANSIGQQIEDDIKFVKFRSEHQEYYDSIISSFKKKNSTDYRYRHRVLTNQMNKREVAWVSWDEATRIKLGAYLVGVCAEQTNLIKVIKTAKRRKTQAMVQATPELLAWIEEHMETSALLDPDAGPCIIKPRAWRGPNDGGFHSHEMARRFPFVKTRSKEHRELLKDADMQDHMDAASALQDTAWAVNTQILDAMQAVYATGHHKALPERDPYIVPEFYLRGKDKETFTEEERGEHLLWKRQAATIYTAENERIAKNLQFLRAFNQARQYSEYPEIYFTYQADFRGRFYAASTGISPQGNDPTKALLHFSRGHALGHRGWHWLQVHGANTYGVDKVDFDERVAWVQENSTAICACAEDPLATDFWVDADKPWQFLAFCYEYAEAQRDPDSFVSYLPIGKDGSCNGLQHFSAMLRDVVGGAAVNLVPGPRPQDIYQRVADLVINKLTEADDPRAVRWLQYGVSRKCTKHSVMTLPYGSTRISCVDSIHDYLLSLEGAPDGYHEQADLSRYLGELVWDSIGEVVVGAREIMQWLRKCASITAKANYPLRWVTGTGFVVHQAAKKVRFQQVRCQLLGVQRLQLSVDTEDLCPRKQANGIVPNLVHSTDSTHLARTVNTCTRRGIEDFAVIHDDYGTHACYVDTLDKTIRAEFVALYSGNILKELYDIWTSDSGLKLPEPPEQRTLHIPDVLKSEYFFA